MWWSCQQRYYPAADRIHRHATCRAWNQSESATLGWGSLSGTIFGIKFVCRSGTDGLQERRRPRGRGAKLEWARPGRRSAEDCGGYLGVLGLLIICFMKSIAASAVGWPEGVAMYSASVSS